VFELTREVPDTDLADVFEGEPMVQSFLVEEKPTGARLPSGERFGASAGQAPLAGRVWITTAEAFLVPGFGRAWVAGRLAAYDPDELPALLAAGLRLRAGELVAA
jgi:hypothetical protein